MHSHRQTSTLPLNRVALTVAVATLLAHPLAIHPGAALAATVAAADDVTDEILVTLNRDTVPEGILSELFVRETAEKYTLVLVRHAPASDLYVFRAASIDAAASTVANLQQDPNVAAASQNRLLRAATNDEAYARQWYLRNTGQQILVGDCPTASFPCDGTSEVQTQSSPGYDVGWETVVPSVYTGVGVRVGIVDSGTDTGHPDLASAVIATANSVSGGGTATDLSGHGTLVAGLVAARADNGIGIAGVAPGSSLVVVKDVDAGGSITLDAVVEGMHQADLLGSDIINISQGSPVDSPTLRSTISTIIAGGKIIVSSAGNYGDDCWSNDCTTYGSLGVSPALYPASYPGVVSVANVDEDGVRHPTSERNAFVSIAAPGTFILGLKSQQVACDGTFSAKRTFLTAEGKTSCTAPYRVSSGTSFSAPIVAGAAALMRQKYGTQLTSQRFMQALQQSSRHPTLPQGQRDDDYGYGLLRIDRLLAYNFPPDGMLAGVSPPVVTSGGGDVVTLSLSLQDLDGAADVRSAYVDLSPLGLSASQALSPDGSNGSTLSYRTSFTVPVDATPGTPTLNVVITDGSGRSYSVGTQLSILQSGAALPAPSSTPVQPLSISITGPNHGEDLVTGSRRVVLRGTTGSDTASVTVDGRPATIDASRGAWRLSLTLFEGENRLQAVAEDVTRTRSATAGITITYDTEPPGDVRALRAEPSGSRTKLSWRRPEDSDVSGYRIYRIVSGRAEEIDITRGRTLVVDGSGPFAVTAEDEVGNESDVEDAPRVTGGRETGFHDVPRAHFASGPVALLRERGIVGGNNGMFLPQTPVTRAEFAKMLAGVRGAGESAAPGGFRDVSRSTPLAGYIGAVVGRGWASGDAGRFFPERHVTRIEASRMIVRAAKLTATGTHIGFRDIPSTEEQLIVQALVASGVVSGQDGRFEPSRPVTRAEAAKMLAAVLL